jgi:hypothetical protein
MCQSKEMTSFMLFTLFALFALLLKSSLRLSPKENIGAAFSSGWMLFLLSLFSLI